MIEVKIPNLIKIGGYDYSIESSAKHDEELEDCDNVGEHSMRLRRIRLRSNCPSQQISETFLHEIIHGIDCVYQGFKLNHDEVIALSNGLFQVMEQLGIRFII